MNEKDILLARVIVSNKDALSPNTSPLPLRKQLYSAEEKKKNFR
jgi:hypothetical protein